MSIIKWQLLCEQQYPNSEGSIDYSYGFSTATHTRTHTYTRKKKVSMAIFSWIWYAIWFSFFFVFLAGWKNFFFPFVFYYVTAAAAVSTTGHSLAMNLFLLTGNWFFLTIIFVLPCVWEDGTNLLLSYHQLSNSSSYSHGLYDFPVKTEMVWYKNICVFKAKKLHHFDYIYIYIYIYIYMVWWLHIWEIIELNLLLCQKILLFIILKE